MAVGTLAVGLAVVLLSWLPPAPSYAQAQSPQVRQPAPDAIPNYRTAMRETVETLSAYGKGRSRSFIVVIRQGLGLLIHDTWEARLQALQAGDQPNDRAVPAGTVKRRFVQTIDGVVLDGQFCIDDPKEVTASQGYLDLIAEIGVTGIVIDHCGAPDAATAAWRAAQRAGLLAHVDTGSGPVGRIPAWAPYGENPDNVFSLSQARNVLVVDDNSSYATRQDWVMALRRTNHDVLVIDPFHRDRDPLTIADVADLRTKNMGARRLVLARLHVSEAADTRWYWKRHWAPGEPEWLGLERRDSPGVHDVLYWHPEWRSLIGEAFTGIMQLGFDGVVLEGMEAYQPLEDGVDIMER